MNSVEFPFTPTIKFLRTKISESLSSGRRRLSVEPGLSMEISEAENLFLKVNFTSGMQKCPVGIGFKEQDGTCQKCTVGTYNLKEDFSGCNDCPSLALCTSDGITVAQTAWLHEDVDKGFLIAVKWV